MPKRTTRRFNQALDTAKREGKDIHIISYEITHDPIINKKDKLPHHVQDELNDLHDLIQTDPRQAIPRLLTLKETYPTIPIIYNFLLAAYSHLGDQQASRALALDNYNNNPDYLFAKINYAQFCLYDGDVEKIPEIFDHKFDLKLLYPKRTKFHVTEFAGFTGVMCAYFSLIGQKETAKLLYGALMEVAPDSNMALFAKSFMSPSLARTIKLWAMGKSRQIAHQIDAEKAKEDKEPPEDSEFTA